MTAAEGKRAAAGMRSAALSAAATAVARHVPDLPGLVANLEFAGGSSRLVAALRAMVGERRMPDVGGAARPNAGLWTGAADGSWR
jgi:hypothetical protein